jgi:hypothetical protein
MVYYQYSTLPREIHYFRESSDVGSADEWKVLMKTLFVFAFPPPPQSTSAARARLLMQEERGNGRGQEWRKRGMETGDRRQETGDKRQETGDNAEHVLPVEQCLVSVTCSVRNGAGLWPS